MPLLVPQGTIRTATRIMVKMNHTEAAVLHAKLLDRRETLASAKRDQPGSAELVRLLHEVDAAVERITLGTFGLCEVCRDPIEPERLMADPLTRVCIDHLSAAERRELEDDLGLARQIQTALLPDRRFAAAGWDTCYHYEPAGLVSGDYCDLVVGSGGLFFLSGDVSGKGVAAALLMSHLHAICRTLLSVGTSIPRFVELANRLFCESTMSSHYATLVCGLASDSGEVEICNAGHCPPVVMRHGETERLEPSGLPIGLFSKASFSSQRIQLDPHDSLFLYTDGLTESCDPDEQEYGEARVLENVKHGHGRPAREIVDGALGHLHAFLSGNRKTDDLTLLVIRRLPVAAESS